MKSNCFICNRVKLSLRGDSPYLIEEFEHSIFVVGDHQLYKGMSFLLLKNHVCEISDLEESLYLSVAKDLQRAGKAVMNTFNVDKMNYCCLGNGDPHVHWHLIPRYKSDDDWGELPYFKKDHPKHHLISQEEAIQIAKQIRENF